jgi:NAD(P)-dependent dehydrogenase (short-subunit alcohol dehydrogenase family)
VDGRFKDKVILITGGNSGMGRDTALLFAREGASVVIAARREAEGKAVVDEIIKQGGAATFVSTDITKASDAEAMVQCAVETYGGLDYAFNNAGLGGQHVPIVDMEEDYFDLLTNVNYKGVWLSMKYEIPAMLERGGGAIVNNNSVAGIAGGSIPGSAYLGSKHGAIGLSKCVASEYASQGIRVNSILPGVIETPMAAKSFEEPGALEFVIGLHPIGRMGKPMEVANAVAFLCSDDASFITGIQMPVDGGMLLAP